MTHFPARGALGEVRIHRSGAIPVPGSMKTVRAEDYPTKELCDTAAVAAAFMLGKGLDLEKIEDGLPYILGCDPERPFGYALIVEDAG